MPVPRQTSAYRGKPDNNNRIFGRPGATHPTHARESTQGPPLPQTTPAQSGGLASLGDSVWGKAQAEQSLVVVGIGYSTCHWCHVMERETFEDEEAASFMNAHFFNVKVDREERPDVDQVYMDAVQLMTKRGGWPLNCVALPDGRPIWGGTYFQKEQWIAGLKAVLEVWKEDPDQVLAYASKLSSAVNALDHHLVNGMAEDDLKEPPTRLATPSVGIEALGNHVGPQAWGTIGAYQKSHFPLNCLSLSGGKLCAARQDSQSKA